MADAANGTQFSNLPPPLVIDILLRLPVKALLTCRYVRKDWTRLYFSDPYFIRSQPETSNIQFLDKDITSEKFRFGCFVEDEVSTGNLRKETLYFSCKFLPTPKYTWRVVNSCNGLVCLIDTVDNSRGGHYGTKYGTTTYSTISNSSVCVCNPILGEWVSIPVPEACYCALGFSAKSNQYKLLLCIAIRERILFSSDKLKYEWEIYTFGTEHWRSIKTKENIAPPWDRYSMDFNSFIHGSLHWTRVRGEEVVVQSFDFETERFTPFWLPVLQSFHWCVRLGVINSCLWASFYNCRQHSNAEMWAMEVYGDDSSWNMMPISSNDPPPNEVFHAKNKRNKECPLVCCHDLLFSLNGEDMLTCHGRLGKVKCYNIETMRRRDLDNQYIGRVTAYYPNFVWLRDFVRGEQLIRDRHFYDVLIKKLVDRAKRLKKKSQKTR